MPKVIAENLDFAINSREILSDLNFDWQERRIGVIGRNGSGKSTLARLIAGLLRPSSGQIRVDGHDLYNERDVALETVGIVFQNPDHQIIFPTVIEELKFGFEQKDGKTAEAPALRVLEKYGKSDWKDRVVHTLSQGQRHFLALISIIELEPKILILDEPFTGLDIPTVARLQNILDQFEGMIIHITHDPHMIANYDRIVWLEAGKIRADGMARDVLPQFEITMQDMGRDDAVTGF